MYYANVRYVAPDGGTVRPLKMVIGFKHHPDVSTKKPQSRNFPGFCNVKKFGFKRLAY